MINFRRNVVLKKAWRYGSAFPRAWRLMGVSGELYKADAPVLVNSVPKSGTYLLQKILGVVDGKRDWGNFLASQPSYSSRVRDGAQMASRASRMVPGELVCGHLHFSKESKEALERLNAVHFLIYRDPRDVAISEAHYLGEMNRWHYMHRTFKPLSESERIALSIRGNESAGGGYPDIGKRYAAFLGWIEDPEVYSVSYERLVSDERALEFRKVFEFLSQKTGQALEIDSLVQRALEAVQPKRSHTFRRGGSGGWRADLDEAAKRDFKAVAGDLLIRLGYEDSTDW
ncbi:sulfotransferase domain-containing protein [Pelagicoccus sp. NFK12]|uniref:Sulfotransferase domain-containing protein n=2 Tax=Pelagicoccus enzymogenes TaxID=2773457 RepID=A0A927FD26_9BACT|nr:sulfotransferase domain-containing protein [Pelagicoccus enzymogenes]